MIKVESTSVVVDVIVTDKRGRPAQGLKASDFAVYDNGVPQKIVTFVPPVPSGGTATAHVSPPASGTQREAFDLAKVHFITLVMDIGDLQPGNFPRAVAAAEDYVRKVVAPEDFVAVYRLDGSLHLAMPFTQDKQKTIDAIHRLGSRTPSGQFTTQARLETEQEVHELEDKVYGFGTATGPGAGQLSSLGPGGAQTAARELTILRAFLFTQSTMQARSVFAAMRGIAEAYRDIPGRKNVVVFSEGFIHSPEAEPQMAAAIDAANRANVAFYIIDANGLNSEYSAVTLGQDPRIATGLFRVSDEPPANLAPQGVDEFDWAKREGSGILHDDLGQMAEATGGFYVKNQNDLLHGLELADRDLREFYTLVYQPAGTVYDGSFHEIKVKLLEGGYNVRSRRGYWAIPPGEETMMAPAAAQLIAAVRRGSLKPAFAPRMNAALLLAPDGSLQIPVEIAVPGSSVGFEQTGDLRRARVTVVLVAWAANGHPASVYQRFLNLDLNKKQWNDFEKRTLHINARLAVPRLEAFKVESILQFSDGVVAVGERAIPLETSRPGQLQLTSLALSSDIEPAQGPGDPSDPLRGANFQIHLPAEPRFASSDKLTAYFGALGLTTGPANLHVSFAILESTRTALGPEAQDVSIPAGQRRLLVLRQFDLKRLKPGEYRLEVTVEDPANRQSRNASADFVVER